MSDDENDVRGAEKPVDEMFGELLISYVRENPCLYNKKVKEYKDRTFVQNTWASIAASLDVNVDAVMKAWKNLRIQFNREHKAQTEYIPSGSGAKRPRKQWYLYEHMTFLIAHIAHRKTTGNIAEASSCSSAASATTSAAASAATSADVSMQASASTTSLPLISPAGSVTSVWSMDLEDMFFEGSSSSAGTSASSAGTSASAAPSRTPTPSSSTAPFPVRVAPHMTTPTAQTGRKRKTLLSPPPDASAQKKMQAADFEVEDLTKVIGETSRSISQSLQAMSERRQAQAQSESTEEEHMAKTLVLGLKRVSDRYKTACYLEWLTSLNKFQQLTLEEDKD